MEQKFGRMMVVVGVLATLGMWVSAALGLRGIAGDADLRVHVLIGLGSLLLFLLAHLWILFYLVGASKAIRAVVLDSGEAPDSVIDPAFLGFRRRTLPPLGLALLAAPGCFLLGIGLYAGAVPAWIHGGAFYLVTAVEAWAAWVQWQTFGAAERSARRADGLDRSGATA